MTDSTIQTISVTDARNILADGQAVFIDIRDPDSYARAHIQGAIRIDDSNVEEFVAATDKANTHVVYCYHGINSQSGAAFFQLKGFTDVYSLDGGFCAWEG